MSKQFSDLGLSAPILKSLENLNIKVPTEIQEKTIPILLNSTKDFVGLAKTGTGKTAAFGLPLLQMIDVEKTQVQAVVLVPTRELGQQIYENLKAYASEIPAISIAAVCGGIPIKPQIERLKEPTQIIVATPGRLIDLVKREAVSIAEASYLVLDEADEMVTSLKTDLNEIFKMLPKKKRTFLFSATLPGITRSLINDYMSKDIEEIKVDMKISGNEKINHKYVIVDPIEKLDVLMHFLSSREGKQGIIFCKTKAAVNKLAKNLAKHKFSSGAIHGSLTQGIRDRIMGQFRDGYIDILIATDLAARGIDVKDLSFVVNYHLPDLYETYVHRSGRTARAGASGLSLSIIQQEEAVDIADFQTELGITFEAYEKPSAENMEDNSALLWAKQIFKTKMNKEVSQEMKMKFRTVLHHLTKEELMDKMLSHYIANQTKKTTEEEPKKKKRRR
ncbi:DEAD/DEAH box helicase [Aureivirga marina]|uniref:DEAD/DEAH box helicase n=1 Tax=Aureivirga marina TaxID=1182451 RepID=UPI0018CBAD8C|nr:DEAD/DEAH box helicase [Aureivirga marina]